MNFTSSGIDFVQSLFLSLTQSLSIYISNHNKICYFISLGLYTPIINKTYLPFPTPCSCVLNVLRFFLMDHKQFTICALILKENAPRNSSAHYSIALQMHCWSLEM